MEYRIDLFDDRAFYKRAAYLGRGDDAVVHDIGSWATAADGSTVALFGDDREPEQWKVVDRSTLRKLDLEGREIRHTTTLGLTDLTATYIHRLARGGIRPYRRRTPQAEPRAGLDPDGTARRSGGEARLRSGRGDARVLRAPQPAAPGTAADAG